MEVIKCFEESCENCLAGCEEPSCGSCLYLDDCPEEWFSAAGGYCENWEIKRA